MGSSGNITCTLALLPGGKLKVTNQIVFGSITEVSGRILGAAPASSWQPCDTLETLSQHNPTEGSYMLMPNNQISITIPTPNVAGGTFSGVFAYSIQNNKIQTIHGTSSQFCAIWGDFMEERIPFERVQ